MDAPNNARFGQQLAQLRKLNGLSLEQLATRSTLTKSYLSKLERGLSQPTIATVLKVGRALNVPPGSLISDDTQEESVLYGTPADRVPFNTTAESESHTYQAIATRRADKVMVPFIMSPPQREGEMLELDGHSGEELIFVLSGTLEVVFEDRTVRMNTGDSLYFNASLPHRSRSIGKERAQALVVISDPAAKS
jgi:transcriptional regulator with XRE-family HTH domain